MFRIGEAKKKRSSRTSQSNAEPEQIKEGVEVVLEDQAFEGASADLTLDENLEPKHHRDSRDEEDDSSDLGYSDDSASLSDAYFYPQPEDDLARPPLLYREQDPLNGHQPFTASNYGSTIERATSPLWVAGSIQEDSVVNPPFGGERKFSVEDVPQTKKERRRQKKLQRQQQRMQLKQREQAARERAVTQIRGQPQEVTSWQDMLFAAIFVAQLIVVLLCALRFGLGVLLFQEDSGWGDYVKAQGHFYWQRNTQETTDNSTMNTLIYDSDTTGSRTDDVYVSINTKTKTKDELSDGSFTIDYKNVIALVGITGFYSCIMTYLSFGFMLILARSLIQIMLVFSILVALGWGLIGLTLDPYGVISIIGFAALLMTLGYTMYNWNRIPFAATNLYTALCAMRCTADITILGLASLIVAFGWCLVWTMAFIGIVNSFNSVDCDKKDACQPHVTNRHIPVYLLLLFSFHWTSTVIKNVVRVTVASAIGTWWFQPGEISPFCSTAVRRALLRSLTKSLGSICLGSLVVQLAQTMAVFGKCCCCMFGGPESSCMRPQKRRREADEENGGSGVVADESTVDSAADTVGLGNRISGVINRVSLYCRSCNRWSFTYIGMYGYSFAEAGERAIQLFETREWMEVVKDNLIQNVLLMASVVIGGSAGVFAVVVEETDGYDFTSFHKPIISAFVIGSVLGFVLSNILLLGVVGSAVNTILVCFAAGPFEFDKNHPRLSREMREVWSQQVWEEPPV